MNSLCISDFAARLRTLEQYSGMVETFLRAESAALEARVTAGMSEHPPSERQEYFEAFLGDILEVSEDLPSLLRFSLVTALDSAVEHLLVSTSHSYAKFLGLTLSQADLRGSTLDRTRRYLKEVVRIPFPDQSKEWTDLQRLKDLRNSIVHRDGQVDASRQALRQWLAAQSGIRLRDGHAVVLEASFISNAIRTCDRFADALDTAIGTRPLTAFEAGFEVVEGGK